MRSFANYRWVLVVTICAAVLAVYFYRPAAAWANRTNNDPQGPTPQRCSQGENASANATPANTDCAACVRVNTPSHARAPDASLLFQPEEITIEIDSDGYILGTTESEAGSSSAPGTKNGMLNPHWGFITMTVPIGICGTPFGFGREGGNVLAMETQADRRPRTKAKSKEKEKVPPPDG